jgi:hypothetical protein
MKNKLSSAVLKYATAPMLAGCLLYAAGCVYPNQPAEVEVDTDPPAPILETVPPSPGPDYVWVGGEWAWHDRWTWERGHWGTPPHPGAIWVPHSYAVHNGKHVFVRGRWK